MIRKTDQKTILLIDDDEDDYLIVRSLLAKIPDSPFVLDWTGDYEHGQELIESAQYDLYLIDYRLGARNGLELLSTIDLFQRKEPFIILTGAGDEEVERAAMRAGAADYLVKGTFGTELLFRVLRYSLQRKHIEAQRVRHLMEVNASKDEFIALASHELRTPASAVKQYLGMLMEGYAGPISDAQEQFVRTAYESNERQIKVVNDILMVAQLDLKKIVMRPEVIDLTKTIRGIIRDTPLLATRKPTVICDVPKDAVKVKADPTYLRMALSNIIENAGKYTPVGKQIRVSVAVQGASVVVTVTDEGVGILAEDLPRLFRKFSRIHNPLSIEVGGTGLGLYWAQEIIRLHRGHIDVDSIYGEGTTFTIRLPKKA